jgi:hypothetical protein
MSNLQLPSEGGGAGGDRQGEKDKIDEIIDALAQDKPLPAREGKLKDFESWDPDKLEEVRNI